MDTKIYFSKVYNVAYRLAGEKEIAAEIAEMAIINTVKQLNENSKVTESMLQLTILELIKIFLKTTKSQCNENINEIQNALLKLNPLNRVVVIWKDVLGYQLSSNMPVEEYTHEELVKELICARKELKENINIA